MFFYSNGFDVNGIIDNRMVQGQDYTVDEASLPSLTPIIFCEWPKMYVIWRYLNGRWSFYELPVLAVFPLFLCPNPLDGNSRHSNWWFGSLGAAQNKQSLWNSTKHSAFSSRVALLWIVSMSSNRFPLSAIFNFGNTQKMQGAMSGLYGGWRISTIFCFAKNCCTRFDECAGALSWSRSQSPLDQKRGRFLLRASRNLFANFLIHEQSIDDHLQSQVADARCFPVLLSAKFSQNEGHTFVYKGLLYHFNRLRATLAEIEAKLDANSFICSFCHFQL